MHLPTGHYLQDKLLNLGSNRYTFRPQLGVVRKSGKWSAELTLSSWFYTDNSKFFGARRLETDPLLTAQGHVDYTFRPGLWVSAGVGYAIGARSTLDRIPKEDKRENLGWIVSFGYPIRRQWGIKIAYTGIRSQRLIGSSTDTLILATSVTW